MAVNVVAQARDFEMGGDNPYRYSMAVLDSNAAIHHAAAGSSHTRRAPSHRAAKPLAKQ
jgi:hypothetical protein